MIEIPLDNIDVDKEVTSVELLLFRKSFNDSIGQSYLDSAEEGAGFSNVRELYRTGFININETYDVWHPDPWPSVLSSMEELVDTFDADDNHTPGWDRFDITDVVLDSLGTARNAVNFALKLRDETKSYARLIDYHSDGDNSTAIDTTQIDAEKLAKYPRVVVVYKDGEALIDKVEPTVPLKVDSDIRIYSINGKLLGIISAEELQSKLLLDVRNYQQLDLTSGLYIVQTGFGSSLKHGKIVID